ncbi:hypothetical protein [Celeribacter persicus]|uniref:Uncharacterized protein n=1 Tax=Celeribacter persicus TaxID=1651082 RepID=A0A2T5HS33_9RHOB|nr:hypothetical protein [Celeribacter persicus]PTQ74380.1 hypothetical protein C8N42_10424 [Celeribacter persicus]
MDTFAGITHPDRNNTPEQRTRHIAPRRRNEGIFVFCNTPLERSGRLI